METESAVSSNSAHEFASSRDEIDEVQSYYQYHSPDMSKIRIAGIDIYNLIW